MNGFYERVTLFASRGVFLRVVKGRSVCITQLNDCIGLRRVSQVSIKNSNNELTDVIIIHILRRNHRSSNPVMFKTTGQVSTSQLKFHCEALVFNIEDHLVSSILKSFLFWMFSPTHLLLVRPHLPGCHHSYFSTISLKGTPSFPSKTLPLPIPENKGVRVAVPLPILSASSPFAFAAHLPGWQCSSNLPTVPTQTQPPCFWRLWPLSTFAVTLLYSEDMAALFVYVMSWDTTGAHALLYKGTWY